jgi:DnaJ homolog subfamily C member 17
MGILSFTFSYPIQYHTMASDESKKLLEFSKEASLDLYKRFGVEDTSTEQQIKSQYRKIAIKWHPDKRPDDPNAANIFDELTKFRDLLLDPEAKSSYDKRQNAEQERKKRYEALDSKRKSMKEDLERRESGFFNKRKREEEDIQARREKELAERGRKMRKEREDRLRRENEQEADVEVEKPGEATNHYDNALKEQEDSPEIERTLIVRWFLDDPQNSSLNEAKLTEKFMLFGGVYHVRISSKQRKVKLEGAKHKRIQATAFVVFRTKASAEAAMAHSKFDFLSSVEWVQPSSVISNGSTSQNVKISPVNSLSDNTPQAPKSWEPTGTTPAKSFTSPSAFSFSPIRGSPGYEEATLARLKAKAAERKKLEEQIRQEEEAEE